MTTEPPVTPTSPPSFPVPPAPVTPYAWASSPAGKAGLILVLLLLMQIPLYLVSGLISERQGRQAEVLTGFRRSWGPAQTLAGPVLAVPYVRSAQTGKPGDKPADDARRQHGWLQIPASQLSIAARLEPETRRRGLFHAVVYTASLGMSGTITIPRIDMTDMASTELLWNEAVLVTAATNLRGQPADAMAEVDGRSVKQVVQAVTGPSCGMAFAAAQIVGQPVEGAIIPFHTRLTLRGTQSFNLVPYGQQIDLLVSAPWSTPGFTGSMLPSTYGIDHAGFSATWQIAGDVSSAGWRLDPRPAPRCFAPDENNEVALGVDLLEPVPTYLMVDRAAKYGTLFLALSFLTYFTFEAVSRVRIHLAQYALLGLSVSLFALLLIALAEPLGFTAGYVLSTIAVMAQASLYTLSVVGSARLAAMFACVLGLLFGFLYVVLRLETFSLLVGTGALFGALSVIMLATRRLDWSGRGTEIPGRAL